MLNGGRQLTNACGNGGFDFLKRPNRSKKPRTTGLTVALDWALSLSEVRSYIETVGDIVDHMKMPDHVGLMWRYSPEYIREKNQLYRSAGIDTLPGGIPFEVAAVQGEVPLFMRRVAKLGFSAVEVSEDSIDFSPIDRKAAIQLGTENGLRVFTELGKKFPDKPLDANEAADTARQDIEHGAHMTVIEKSDVEIVMRNSSDVLHHIVEIVGKDKVIIECGPGANRFEIARWLIKEFGANVNLENIDANEVYALEAIRHGLHRSVEFCYFHPFKGKKLPSVLPSKSSA